MKEGINFDGQVISALFFAEDLVLTSHTKPRGMERMLRVVSKFCEGMDMRLAVEKDHNLIQQSAGNTVWKMDKDDPSLEAFLVGKYVGIDIQVKGWSLIKVREEKMLAIAQNFGPFP